MTNKDKNRVDITLSQKEWKIASERARISYMKVDPFLRFSSVYVR